MDGDPPDLSTVYHTGRSRSFESHDPTAVPRPFALCDYDGDVMAYGMTLPDGSAVTVQWSDGSHGSVGLWTSPAAPARLWAYSIAWFDRPVGSRPLPS
jgi:hypothetical protein